MDSKPFSTMLMCILVGLAPACGTDDESPTPADENDLGAPNPDGDAQTPPTTSDELEAWLENGDYKSWACETVEHAQLKVSPHGFNRVCSNDLASTFDGAVDDERPVGTASVKELYDDSSTLVGYALSLKVDAESKGGGNWFWYERIAENTVANGLGVPGCIGCHMGAGTDDMHDVSASSDFVYLQVAP